MTKEEIEKYKEYPEGSGGKKIYDLAHLSFSEYLEKYFKEPDLIRWRYINSKYVIPLFDGTIWKDYWHFLNQAKPNFSPVENKAKEFLDTIKEDTRFDIDLKQFFAFLYSISFFRELSFEEWLRIGNWTCPWNKSKDEKSKSILAILSHHNGSNYLKVQLGNLSIF